MPHVLLNCAFAEDVKAQLEQFATNTYRPHSRLSLAISLINATVSAAIFGLGAAVLDLYIQKSRASLAMPPEQRLWLDNEQGLFPDLNRPR